MKVELEALEKANTWTIQDHPPNNKKPIGCRWVYKVKTKSNGTLERLKARLVAKGYFSKIWNRLRRNLCPNS